MPVINIQLVSGRTPAQKLALIKEVAGATSRTLGVPEDAVRILLTEFEPENYALGSQTMAELRAGAI